MQRKNENLHSQPEFKKENVLVLSLDFDGCIFNNQYSKDNSGSLIAANKLLFGWIESEVKKGNYDRVVLMVGSNRQSYRSDKLNSERNNTESCFTAIQTLQEEVSERLSIPCELEQYLISDSYGILKAHGDNFKNILEILKGKGRGYLLDDFVWDTYKISLLYAQLHLIATKYKNANIDFRFLDDRKDILSKLADFYSKYKLFIPNNVLFSMYRYIGTQLKQFIFPNEVAIKGLGAPDFNFDDNIRLLAGCCRLNSLTKDDDMSHYLNDEVINKFRHQRSLDSVARCVELGYEINSLEKLTKHTSEFCELIDSLKMLQELLLTNIQKQKAQNFSEYKIRNSKEFDLAEHALRMVRDFTLPKVPTFQNKVNDFIKKYENEPVFKVLNPVYSSSVAKYGILGGIIKPQNVSKLVNKNPEKIAANVARALKKLGESKQQQQLRV